MNLNNLATGELSFSAVESSMKLCNGVLCLPSWKLGRLFQHAGGFASRNYLDLQYPQMNLNNLATCGLSFSAVEASMKLRNGVLCLPSWKL